MLYIIPYKYFKSVPSSKRKKIPKQSSNNNNKNKISNSYIDYKCHSEILQHSHLHVESNMRNRNEWKRKEIYTIQVNPMKCQ